MAADPVTVRAIVGIVGVVARLAKFWVFMVSVDWIAEENDAAKLGEKIG